MRSRFIFSILTVALLCTSAHGQWTSIGPAGMTGGKDMIVRNGILLVLTSAGANSARISRSSDGGATWNVINQDPKSVVWTGTRYFAAHTLTSKMYAADHEALVWNDVLAQGTTYYNVNQLYHDSTTGKTYGASDRAYSLMLSTDEGNTWTTMGAGSGAQDNTGVHARGNKIIGYYNGSSGNHKFSVDGGVTWSPKNWPFRTGIGQQASGYPSGAYVAANGDLYASGVTGEWGFQGSKLMRSRDNGITWDSLTGALPGVKLQERATIFVEGSRILFGAGHKVVFSNDDGATWSDKSDGLPTATSGTIPSVSLDDANIYVLVGSGEAAGVYRRPKSDFGFTGAAISAVEGSASAKSLRVINTVDGHSIEVHLGRPADVNVQIYDMLGRPRTTLHDGVTKEVKLQVPSNLPRGCYIVRAAIGDHLECATIMH